MHLHLVIQIKLSQTFTDSLISLWQVVWSVLYCCVTKCHRLRELKHLFVFSQLLWIWGPGLGKLALRRLNNELGGAIISSEAQGRHINLFSLVPWNCRMEISIFLLAISQVSPSASESELPVLTKHGGRAK